MSRALRALDHLSSFKRLHNSSPSTSTTSSFSSTDTLLPHTDPLPASPDGLKGRLNYLASQLQNMVTRVEALNEMIEMEGIMLTRLGKEQKEIAKKHAEERDIMGKVHFKAPGEFPRDGVEDKGGFVPAVTMEMWNKQTLVADMKKMRKAMERSVLWQRDEYWRVERAMGKRTLSLGSKE